MPTPKEVNVPCYYSGVPPGTQVRDSLKPKLDPYAKNSNAKVKKKVINNGLWQYNEWKVLAVNETTVRNLIDAEPGSRSTPGEPLQLFLGDLKSGTPDGVVFAHASFVDDDQYVGINDEAGSSFGFLLGLSGYSDGQSLTPSKPTLLVLTVAQGGGTLTIPAGTPITLNFADGGSLALNLGTQLVIAPSTTPTSSSGYIAWITEGGDLYLWVQIDTAGQIIDGPYEYEDSVAQGKKL